MGLLSNTCVWVFITLIFFFAFGAYKCAKRGDDDACDFAIGVIGGLVVGGVLGLLFACGIWG